MAKRIDGDIPTYNECYRHAAAGFTDTVPQTTAESCAERFPDDFAADYVGRRQVKLWHVEFTWSRLWKNLWN